MEVCKSEKCTGCGACYSICRRHAISMVYDLLGCIRPSIDDNKCINCGMCEQICPSNNMPDVKNPIRYYAAQSVNDNLLVRSSSGGVFPVLATWIIQIGGVVYGAAWNRNHDNNCLEGAKCRRISTVEEIKELQNSKYLQIELHNIYPELLRDLKQSKVVLFTGTPCQIAAVNKIVPDVLKEKLYTLDIVCHGVCGQKFFMDFYHRFSKNRKIVEFVFRSKENGWGLAAHVDFEKNGVIQRKIYPCGVLSYYQIFLRGHMYRNPCYTCMYARRERVSDISAGDYWGVQDEHPYLAKAIDIKKGCSFISLNSRKGEVLFEKIADKMICYPTDYENISRHNDQLVNPSKIGKYRNDYSKLYANYGYDSVEKFFAKNERNKKAYRHFLIRYILNKVKKHTLGFR